MGEAFFWALEARLRDGRPHLSNTPAPALDDDPLPCGGAADNREAAGHDDGVTADCDGAGSGQVAPYVGGAALDDERVAGQDGAALSRADFEALVGQELRNFAYNRPHHALDFRIACSCAPASMHCRAKVFLIVLPGDSFARCCPNLNPVHC